MDGESTDNTRSVAKQYGATVIPNTNILAEPGVNLGMEKAHGDLCMIIAVDNIYKNVDAIEKIAQVFTDPSIYAAFPKHDTDPADNLFSKYINTFTDPFNHFVYGYAANARTFHKVYKTLEHNDIYDVYDFTSNEIRPMLAFAQGFTIRSEFRRKQSDAFDDVSPVLDLVQQEKKIAYVHSVPLYHYTVQNIHHFIRKQRWTTQNALDNTHYGIAHRKTTLTSGQKQRMLLWPLYAFSFIIPLCRGIIGYIIDKEPMWLFHPVMCWISAYASLTQVIVYNMTKSRITRQ
jgi:glycosyltransferase involved in cell wall biosynthesis